MDPARLTRLIDRVAESASAPKVIRAYHGSPYDFDRFDASKIGTGEGHQSFGHGMYFAGAEPTAKYYRDVLVADAPYQSAEQAAADYLAVNGGDAPSALKVLSMHAAKPGQFGYGTADQQEIIRRARELVESGAPIAPRERAGHMYEVEIGHPEEALLDWDRPMGESVAARLTPKLRGGLERGIRDRLDMGQLGRHADNLRAMRDNPSLAPGQVLHEGLSADYGRVAAARGLLDAGIPGIRYLDAGSRAAGEGTRNYVVFPGAEDSIRILRKFAVPGAVGVGAASMGGGG